VNCSAVSGVDCGLELATLPGSWHYVITYSAASSPVEFAISVELTGQLYLKLHIADNPQFTLSKKIQRSLPVTVVARRQRRFLLNVSCA
jgi:hypothetical protein